MNKTKSFALATPLALSLAIGSILSIPQTANAGVCDPEIAQRAIELRREEAQREMKRIEQIMRGHMRQPPWLAKALGLLTGCSFYNFPMPPMGNKFAGAITQLANGAMDLASQKACDLAREKVMEAAGKYEETMSTVEGHVDFLENLERGDWEGAYQTWPGSNPLPGGGNLPNLGGDGIDWGGLSGIIPGGGSNPPPPKGPPDWRNPPTHPCNDPNYAGVCD